MKENIPLKPEEEIKSIIGYEGLYSITSFGRVWSHAKKKGFVEQEGKFLKCNLDKYGYLYHNLSKDKKPKSFKIHRLVAQHFVFNLQNLPEVNHKDGNKQNNKRGNLEWCTSQENHNHATINHLRNKKSSRFYGVCYYKLWKKLKPWCARINVNKKKYYLGSFKTKDEAYEAYNKYVLDHNLNRSLNKGVYFSEYNKTSKVWSVRVTKDGKLVYVGQYRTELEAAQAYNDYVIEHNLNRPLNDLGGK